MEFRAKQLTGLIAGVLLALLLAHSHGQIFTHTEARHTHSLCMTPDGTRLLALHSEGARLCVFDLSGETPTLVAEIPVGLEPVAVRARTDDEAWVVSELGDSVAIVSLSRRTVIDTLRTPDEPADVAFAAGKAFVSCSRNNLVRVFDAVSRTELASIPLAGLVPRALAVDAAGTKIYAAFLHSGNGTTILPHTLAPAPPPPANSALPPAPRTALIVPATDPRISFGVLDRDVAEVDVATLAVTRYFSGAGTNLLDLAVQPVTGDLWVANTEALNLTRFEPNLRGHFVDNRVTRLAAVDGAATVFDLNAGLDYSLLPNPAALATALAQPSAVVFRADGAEAWIAAFASDRIARISTADGAVLGSTDLRAPVEGSRKMRGPRALVLDDARECLYVLNKLSGTLSVLNSTTGALVTETPLVAADPMPVAVREGRGYLFDARLSGNGTASCASCHLDADRDGLAWDLGDPGGEMTSVIGRNLSAHDTQPRTRFMHPMKGPMTTQTLRGLAGNAPFHWRGDRPTIQSFNATFDRLMGGAQLVSADIGAMTAYLLTLRHHPNPNRAADNTLPAQFLGGNPIRGQTLFNQHNNHCGVCHKLPRGTDNNIDLHQEVGATQPIKNPSLATVYQRLLFNPRAGQQSLSGFGLGHDGKGSELPTVHPYVLDQLSGQDFDDVTAFVLCFDTGSAPAVGASVTVRASNSAVMNAEVARLEVQNQDSAIDLVVRGVMGGEEVAFIFSRSLQLYVPSRGGAGLLSRGALLAALGPDDFLTFLGAPPGEGARFGGTIDQEPALFADSYFLRNTKRPFEVPATLGVLANDLHLAIPDDTALLSETPALGSVTLAADGSFAYTPGSDFNATGVDAFSYQVAIGGDPQNVTAEVDVTVSTLKSAAGRYFALLRDDAGGGISGYANIAVGAGGTWTGKARVGNTVQVLRGRVDTDGALRAKGKPKLDVSLRLFAQPDGRRRIRAHVRDGKSLFTGEAQRSPFTREVPAPHSGRWPLVLAIADSTPGAPTAEGTAKATITSLGKAKLVGRLGDKTPFSISVPLQERTGGGWLLPVFAPVYSAPPGSVAGELELDPATLTGIAGSLTAVRPPQSRPRNPAPPFTIRYSVSEASNP